MVRFMRRWLLAAALVSCGACASAQSVAPVSPASPSASGPPAPVEVNRANDAELDGLRGIGPSLSRRILQARASGAFANWPDLMQRVKGIREAKATQLSAAGLTVQGEPYRPGAAQAP